VWTFAAANNSDPASGKFTTDNASPASTTVLHLSNKQKGDVAGVGIGTQLTSIAAGSLLLFYSSTGQPYPATISAANNGGDYTILNVSFPSGLPNWAGDFTAVIWPAPQTLANILANAGISPVADGTVTPLTSGTTQSGIVTALS
jgi:hypothetical protein